jgi:glutathione peroxidase
MDIKMRLWAKNGFGATVFVTVVATSITSAPLAAQTGLTGQTGLTAPTSPSSVNCPTVLNREVVRLQDEKPQSLCQYAGKVVVVVNTASFCGFTSQYKGLEDLHKRYRDRGLVVLGFPSNDFGAQEPGSNKDIASLCENTFGVKFPMFTKTNVAASSGASLSPLYADLKRITGVSPRWNFHKYVIARNGQTALSFTSEVEPSSAAFTKQVEQLLDAK